MFGLGCAAKWIGMYAGVGLAVLFFMGKYNEISEYSRRIRDFMNKYFWRIVLLCCIFFVVIPLTIYMLSYIPVQAAEGHAKGFKAWWDAQTLMFNYHSGLVAEHPFSSDWWEWPLDIRPVLLYRGYDLPTGMTSSASTMGNPLIWWLSVPSVIAAAVIAWKKRDRRALPVLAAYLSQYVPWMLVPRLVFIYHYFSCVPFAILAIVYVMEYLMENYRHAKYFCYAFTGVCVILFAAFWPVLSGYPVSNDYVNALKWLQSWPF
jgi:dolichyl-phosphate-mannose--protein O-mannosyl transferase